MTIRQIYSHCLGLFLLVGWSCVVLAESTLPNNATYDDIIERGRIDIAVYKDFPPFAFRQEGKLVGVDVDLGNLIAEKLGVKASFRELVAGEKVDDDLRNAIWKGHYLGGGIVDLMMHVPVNRDFARRNEFVVIFGPYYQEKLALIRNIEKTGDTRSLAVYRYEKVGVELDSLPDFYLSAAMGGIFQQNVMHYRTIPEATDALKAGEIAAVFANLSQIEAEFNGIPDVYDLGEVLSPGLHTNNWTLGVAVSHRSRQLGYAIGDIIDELLRDGTVADVFARYGLTYNPPDY